MKTLCLILLFHASLQLQCDKKEITAHIGDDIFVACKYDTSRYLFSKKYWCRGSTRNSCEILVDSDGVAKTIYTKRCQIIDARREGLFVKVSNLQIEDSGVYWIGIDKIYADIMISVNIVVTEVPVCKPRLWPLSSLENRQTCWGESVTVRCGCEKGTGIRYTWYQHPQHNDFLFHGSSDLSLNCTTASSNSEFYCSASNSISRKQSEILSVQVLVPANSSCVYSINIQGHPVYDCLDRMNPTTTETPPLTTSKYTTKIHFHTADVLLPTNQTHPHVFFLRTWSGVPFWYTLLRWGSFASFLVTLCVVLKCTKTRHSKSGGRRLRRGKDNI